MNGKQIYIFEMKLFTLIAEKTRAIPQPIISAENDLSRDSEDEFFGIKTDDSTMSEISSV